MRKGLGLELGSIYGLGLEILYLASHIWVGSGGGPGCLGAVCDEAMAACLADWQGTKKAVLRVVISSSADGFQ